MSKAEDKRAQELARQIKEIYDRNASWREVGGREKDIAALLAPHLAGEWSKAVWDILAERAKQVARGYTSEHDDEHDMGELGLAAALDALPYSANIDGEPLMKQDDHIGLDILLEIGFDFHIEPIENDRDRLVRAGALLIAEIERLDRLIGKERR